MTELEKKIYDCAMEVIPELKEHIKSIKTEFRYLEFPFFCDGVIDVLIYDTEFNIFTKIRCLKGKGKGVSIEGMSNFSAFYDEVETKEIDLTKIEL